MNQAGAVRYERLPGRARRLFGSNSLYAAEDHLLLVNRQAYSEAYRRYYYRDIQSIAMYRDDRGSVWWALWGLTAILTIAPAIMSLMAGAWGRWLWCAAAGAALTGLGVHWWRGPTCRCRMRTILQEVEVAPLRRERWLRAALAVVEPRIVATQGAFEPAMLQDETNEQAVTPDAPIRMAGSAVPPPPLPRGSTRLHDLLCYMFLADALVTTLQVALPGVLFSWLGSALALTEFGVVITLLTRRNATLLGRILKPFTWIAFGVLCLTALSSWIVGIITGIRAAAEMHSEGAQPLRAPMWVYLTYVIIYVVIGIFGMTLLRRYRYEAEHRWLNLKG